ncbi:acyl-CoA thioesterase domain-containing protein [Nocardioides sp. zg-DK7169]|uniref:acyl-CoA thioesterase domain-containing protein n=1 Tax=Nocardioides sp. zg-DK7169 TaxID=2736600 RepID=UPI001553828E|nr:acyl-CoA thioesterase domain-containing protein [Nocardioides sp. zg-DK7169]NPC97134.1 thioesterase family protein [Nocardioides sp. zg-DK7169]
MTAASTSSPDSPTGPGYYRLDEATGELLATDLAASMWGENHLHGVAVSGAMARALEHRVAELGRADLRPARYTVDLFRPATTDPCVVRTEVVREGNRLCLVDATYLQDDVAVARASGLFLRATGSTAGETWSPGSGAESDLVPPPLEIAPVTTEAHVPFIHSDDVGWSQDFTQHQNASRKQSWSTGPSVVVGEAPTPFQAVASLADGASLVTNWGSLGVEHINTDITLVLAREPDGVSIGLAATDRREDGGIAVGTAAVFDRSGRLGTVVVSALANAKRVVDFARVEYADDGTRRTSPGA